MNTEKMIKHLRNIVNLVCSPIRKMPENDIIGNYWYYFETFFKVNSAEKIKEKLQVVKCAYLLEKYIKQNIIDIELASHEDEEIVFQYIFDKMKDEIRLKQVHSLQDDISEVSGVTFSTDQVEKFEAKFFDLKKKIKKIEGDIGKNTDSKILEKLRLRMKECRKKLRHIKNTIQFETVGVLKSTENTKVYLLLDKKRIRFVVFKVVLLKNTDERYGEMHLGGIGHKKIIEIYKTKQTDTFLVTEQEYFPGISLTQCHTFMKRWNTPKKLLLLKEIIQVIKILHDVNFVHLNIQPDNVLINLFNERIEIKIIGLQHSLKISRTIENFDIQKLGVLPTQLKEFFKIKLTIETAKAIDIWGFASIAQSMFEQSLELLEGEVEIGVLHCLQNALAFGEENHLKANEVNNILRITYPLYTETKSSRMHKILKSQLDHFENSGNSGIITVETKNGKAEIVFQEGTLIFAGYGDLTGSKVIEELTDEITIIKNVHHIYKTILGEYEVEPVNITSFLVNSSNYNDILAGNRNLLKNFIREQLEADTFISCNGLEGVCYSQKLKKWSYENLVFGTNLFLCTIGQRSLILCSHCIEAMSKKIPQSIPHIFKKFETFLVNKGNFNNEYYMCFKDGRRVYTGIYFSKPSLAKSLYRSYLLLKEYPCRHLIQFLDFYDVKNTKTGFLVTEYFPSISLLRLFSGNENFPESLKMFLLFELTRALNSLHRRNIVHRKITFSSILLGVDGQVKLGDFTLCKVTENSIEDAKVNIEEGVVLGEGEVIIDELIGKTNLLGVMEYCSPEFRKSMSTVTTAADIWSWGVVAYKLFTGEYPFKAYDCRRGHYIMPDIDALVFENDKYEIIKDLIQQSLQIDPEKRITAQEIESHLYGLIFP